MSDTTIRQRRRVNLEPTAEEIEAAKASEAHAASAIPAVHEGFIMVQRVAYGQEEETTEKVRVPLFGTEVARIRVSAGSTNNLGDYNSARVDVTIELPCYPVRSEIENAYNFIEGLLDEIIPIELAKAGVSVESQG